MSGSEMNPCDHIRGQIAFYLDDELRGREQSAFEVHLRECAACRQTVEHERRFLENLREARPLCSPPPVLRARLEEMLGDALAPYTAPPELRHRIQRFLWPAIPHRLIHRRRV